MFGGVSHLSIDPKNRLSIPAKYREYLQQTGGRMVATLESPQCLILYPENNWFAVRNKIQDLSTAAHPQVKSYQRLVLGYAETLELDKSGRILLPIVLKKLVQLEKDVILVGLGNRFELWDQLKWQEKTAQALQLSHDQLAHLLTGFSL